ncbi:hypothetical protein BD289DRAFT_119803 [Coniella lustricola]|uniref:Uncharacterized protein n=1 Tax=Coniella lustricola TaxID=2025994 RepID=A0A2T3AG26_9PEZI|nr:hypothetical protein BD289DRAFT_119803 [Coniella lustricola]
MDFLRLTSWETFSSVSFLSLSLSLFFLSFFFFDNGFLSHFLSSFASITLLRVGRDRKLRSRRVRFCTLELLILRCVILRGQIHTWLWEISINTLSVMENGNGPWNRLRSDVSFFSFLLSSVLQTLGLRSWPACMRLSIIIVRPIFIHSFDSIHLLNQDISLNHATYTQPVVWKRAGKGEANRAGIMGIFWKYMRLNMDMDNKKTTNVVHKVVLSLGITLIVSREVNLTGL